MSKIYSIEKSPIIPCGPRLVVRRLESSPKTQGGLYLSEGEKEVVPFGVVLSLGSKIEDEKIKVGVCVHLGKYAGTEVVVNRNTYVIIREEEINGIVCDAEVIKDFVNAGVSL